MKKPSSTRTKAAKKTVLRLVPPPPDATPARRPSPPPQTASIPFIAPQLATLVDHAPEGEEWVHELKFDGFRVLCRIEAGQVTLFTRSGQDWTERFAEVAVAAAKLRVKSALLDGEVAVLRDDGKTDFQALQNHLQGTSKGALTYFAFDLLFLDGVDVRGRTLDERKAALAKIIPTDKRTIRYSDHVIGNGDAFFQKACDAGLEGIVSKRRDQPYRSGRSPSWVKTKAIKRQEVVIGGFTEPEGSRTGIGALLVGFFKGDVLGYAGKVGTGFTHKSAVDMRRRLDQLVTPRSPFEEKVPPEGRQVRWVKPQLVAEVAYSEITSDGKLRHPSFQGMREDKPAREVVGEIPSQAVPAPPSSPPPAASPSKAPHLPSAAKPTKARAAATSKIVKEVTADAAPSPPAGPSPRRKGDKDVVQIAGVTLSHPERVLEQTGGLTKRHLAEYLEAVAPYMLPHLIGRPLSLVRCPGGLSAKCFFMKHAAFATPEFRRITIREKEDKGEYLLADTTTSLIALAQMSVLEIHTWNSVEKTLEQPDRVVFDFDPGPQAPWQTVVDGALLIKRRVEQIGCPTFLKTTGGKGLHVVVPLLPNADWEECRTFSQLVSESVATEDPRRFTTTIRKAGREDKVLIDYFRNTRGATSVSVYSTRARPGITVSLPIAWEELPDFSPERPFTMASTIARVQGRYRDPWARYENSRVDLKEVILKTRGPRASRIPAPNS